VQRQKDLKEQLLMFSLIWLSKSLDYTVQKRKKKYGKKKKKIFIKQHIKAALKKKNVLIVNFQNFWDAMKVSSFENQSKEYIVELISNK